MRKPAKIRFFPGRKPGYIITNEGAGLAGDSPPSGPPAGESFNMTIGNNLANYGYIASEYGSVDNDQLFGETLSACRFRSGANSGNLEFSGVQITGVTDISVSVDSEPAVVFSWNGSFYLANDASLANYFVANNGNTVAVVLTEL